MEQKCLVTKLKASVDNDSLTIFGKARIKASSVTGNVAMWITCDKDSVAEIKSPTGEVLLTENCLANVRKSVAIDASPYEYVIYFVDSYHTTLLYGHDNSQYGAATDAKYALNLSEFNYGAIESIGNITINFKEEELKNMSLPNLKNFDVGHISDLLSLVSLYGMTSMIRRKEGSTIRISGRFETLLEEWIKKGRNSGSCEISNYGDSDERTFNNHNVGWTTFTVNFTETGCSITPGINFVEHTLCSGATYDKNTSQWTYLPTE